MENLLKQDSINFEILDSKENLIQVLLLPNQVLYTEQEYIMYSSVNLVVRYSTYKWYRRLFRSPIGSQIRIKNRNGGVEYIGLSKSTEKIIVINPSIYDESVIIDKNCVLGYTSGVKLNLVSPNGLLKHTEWREFKGNGFVFLQSDGGLTEKKLGFDEEFTVAKRNIVLHSKGVKISECAVFRDVMPGPESRKRLVDMKGPGIVYFVSYNSVSEFGKSKYGISRNDVLFGVLIFVLLLIDWI